MSNWRNSSIHSVEEPFLTDFFRAWAFDTIDNGWSIPEVDASVQFMRKAYEKGGSLGDSLVEVLKMQREGRLVPQES